MFPMKATSIEQPLQVHARVYVCFVLLNVLVQKGSVCVRVCIYKYTYIYIHIYTYIYIYIHVADTPLCVAVGGRNEGTMVLFPYFCYRYEPLCTLYINQHRSYQIL